MKKILLIIIMGLIAFIANSEDLTKLSKEVREKRLINIAKEIALKYGDSRYWVDEADYEIVILPANPKHPYSKKELYRITFINEFAKKYMEYGHLVSVDIETGTGIAIAIDFGNGWGVPVKNDSIKTKSADKIKKMPYQHLPIKVWVCLHCPSHKGFWDYFQHTNEFAQEGNLIGGLILDMLSHNRDDASKEPTDRNNAVEAMGEIIESLIDIKTSKISNDEKKARTTEVVNYWEGKYNANL